jgi:nitrous oxidase accessory protein NosD
MKTVTATAIVSTASAFLTSLVFVGIINVATTSNVSASVTPIQTVTVQAKRMSAEDKLAYDLELAQIQTVVIRQAGMTQAEKLAYDAEFSRTQTVTVHTPQMTVEEKAAYDFEVAPK